MVALGLAIGGRVEYSFIRGHEDFAASVVRKVSSSLTKAGLMSG